VIVIAPSSATFAAVDASGTPARSDAIAALMFRCEKSRAGPSAYDGSPSENCRTFFRSL